MGGSRMRLVRRAERLTTALQTLKIVIFNYF
jgi:hypothetical protein